MSGIQNPDWVYLLSKGESMTKKCICTDGRACCPIHDNPHMVSMRITAQQRDRNNIIRKLVFKARDLSYGLSLCQSPEEMARNFNYIQKDAEELAMIVLEMQGTDQ